MRSCCCDPTPPGCDLSFDTDIYIGYKDGTEVNLADLRAKFSGTPTEFNTIFWEKSKGIPSYINVVVRKSSVYAYDTALTWSCGTVPPKPLNAADVSFEFSIGDKIKYSKTDAVTGALDVFNLSHVVEGITCFKNTSDPHVKTANFTHPATQDIVVPDIAFELAQDVVNLYFGGTAGWSEKEFSFKTKPDFDDFFSENDMQSYSMKIQFSSNVTEKNFSEVDVSLSSDKVSAITGVTGSDVSPIVVTAGAHGFRTGDEVQISGVTGNTAANGSFTIDYINPYQFSLNDTIGNGDYTGGGEVQIKRKVLLFTNIFNVAGTNRDHRYKLGGWLYSYGISNDEGRRLTNILTGREELPIGIPIDTIPEVTVTAAQPETDSNAEIDPPIYFDSETDRPAGFGLATGGNVTVKLTTYNSYYKDQFFWGPTASKTLRITAEHPLYVYGGSIMGFDGLLDGTQGNSEWHSLQNRREGAMAAPTNVVRIGYGSVSPTYVTYIDSDRVPRPFYGNWINGYDIILTITKVYKWKEEGSLSGRIVDREETIVHEVNVGKQSYVHAACSPIVALCAGSEQEPFGQLTDDTFSDDRGGLRNADRSLVFGHDPFVYASNLFQAGFMVNNNKATELCNTYEEKIVKVKTPLIDSKSVKGRIDGFDDIRERCDVPIPTPKPSTVECVGNINDPTFDEVTCFTKVTGTTETENDDGETETSDILETTCYKCWDNYAEYQADYLSKTNGIKLYKEYTAYGTRDKQKLWPSGRSGPLIRCLDKPGHTLHTAKGVYHYDLDNWPQYQEGYETTRDGYSTGNKAYYTHYWTDIASPLVIPAKGSPKIFGAEEYLPTHKWSLQCVSGTVTADRGAHSACYWNFPQADDSAHGTPDRYKNLEFITDAVFYIYPQAKYPDFEIQDYISQFPAVYYTGWAYEAPTATDCHNLFGSSANFENKTTGYGEPDPSNGKRYPITETVPNAVDWTETNAYLTKVVAGKSGFELYTKTETHWTGLNYMDEITNPSESVCSVDITTPDSDYIQDRCGQASLVPLNIGPSVSNTTLGRPIDAAFEQAITYLSTDRIFQNDLLSAGSYDLHWKKDLELIPVSKLTVDAVNDDYSNGSISAQTDTSEYWLQNSSQVLEDAYTEAGRITMIPPVLPRNYIDPWGKVEDREFCPVTSETRQVGMFGFDIVTIPKDKYCAQKWKDNAFVNSEYSFKVDTNFTISENKVICRGNDDSTALDDCTYVPSIDVTTTKCLRKKCQQPLAICSPPAQIFEPTSVTTGTTVYSPALGKMDCPDGDAYDTFDCINEDNHCHDGETAVTGRDWTLQNNSTTITGTVIDPYVTFSHTTTFNTFIDLDEGGANPAELVEVIRKRDCDAYFEFASKLNVIGKGKGDCRSKVWGAGTMSTGGLHYTTQIASDIIEWTTALGTPFGNAEANYSSTVRFTGDATVCTDIAYCSEINSACIEIGATCRTCGGSNNTHVIPTIKEGNMSQSIVTCKGKCLPDFFGREAGNCATTTFLCARDTCRHTLRRPLKAEIKGLCEASGPSSFPLPYSPSNAWIWDGGTTAGVDIVYPYSYVDEATDHVEKTLVTTKTTLVFESLSETSLHLLLPDKIVPRVPLECRVNDTSYLKPLSGSPKRSDWIAASDELETGVLMLVSSAAGTAETSVTEYASCCNKADCK